MTSSKCSLLPQASMALSGLLTLTAVKQQYFGTLNFALRYDNLKKVTPNRWNIPPDKDTYIPIWLKQALLPRKSWTLKQFIALLVKNSQKKSQKIHKK